LHWDFKTFYDNENAVLFNKYSSIIENERVRFYMPVQWSNLGSELIPSAVVSPFSKSFIFRFKSAYTSNNINFLFTTYIGSDTRKKGVMIRVINGYIEVLLCGRQSPPDYNTTVLHRTYEPIAGYPEVLIDAFCQMVITFDHETDIIKTYINGVQNSSITARNPSLGQSDFDIGTGFGGSIYFYLHKNLHKWSDNTSYGLMEIDYLKKKNSTLSQEEVTRYYDESIALKKNVIKAKKYDAYRECSYYWWSGSKSHNDDLLECQAFKM
jgi:hypothetical protein